ncbi:MAG: hypothetical protein KGK09_07715 [Burkholderiales bacterium]|nr:hypothetical protein [Burkholderiales bacterium]
MDSRARHDRKAAALGRRGPALGLSLALALALAGPALQAQAQGPAGSAMQPLPVEQNPPGDIPDSQVFVEYRSPQGVSLKVPEGWARRDGAGAVRFADKYNAVELEVTPRAAAPTVAGLRATELAALARLPSAVEIRSVGQARLPAGPAVIVRYRDNSERDPVTDKAIRRDNERLYFWHAGRQAVLTLSAPAGADNADQWQLMARSLAWTK